MHHWIQCRSSRLPPFFDCRFNTSPLPLSLHTPLSYLSISDEILHNSGGIDLGNGCNWAPTVDGVELTYATQHQVQAGKFNRVPVMLGTNTDEGSTFVLPCDANDEVFISFFLFFFLFFPSFFPFPPPSNLSKNQRIL